VKRASFELGDVVRAIRPNQAIGIGEEATVYSRDASAGDPGRLIRIRNKGGECGSILSADDFELVTAAAATAPCGQCGDWIPIAATVCPLCHRDPDGLVPCHDCDPDGAGEPTGVETLWFRANPLLDTTIQCRTCAGERVMEPPFALEREAALLKARKRQEEKSDG
jgi:hypothetical protein